MLKVKVPLKVTASRVKTVAGPHIHLEDNIHLLLSLVAAGSSTRWEPHLLVDRLGLLGSEGVSIVTGAVVLADYEGDRKSLVEELQGIPGRIYIPPWGFPLLLVFEASKPDNEVMTGLHIAGLEKAKVTIRRIKEKIIVITV